VMGKKDEITLLAIPDPDAGLHLEDLTSWACFESSL
jgi:hypothetical protein